jgi:UDP-N-acetylmuramoyl-tripeptide--D-alanyl-D-alanine ligase
VKQFIHNYILRGLVSNRIVVPYLFFWGRFVVRIRQPLIIGVTGSVGKTTTTEMIAAVLAHPEVQPLVGRVGKTANNMNNDVGLPLTVLRYEHWLPRHQKLVMLGGLPFRAVRLATTGCYPNLLVLEYGTHWHGHLSRLAQLAPPRVAVVTTIGPAHLDRLQTLEGVVQEKSALVRAVPPSGLVILGQDHPYVSHLERAARAPVVKVPGRGLELSQNITRAVCQYLGIPDEVRLTALDNFILPKGRLNRLEFADLTVIDDSFNANPLSMQLGLDTLAETAKPGHRRVAILGVMGELGEESPQYHEEIGVYARSRVDVVIGVGDLAQYYHADHWFDSSNACAAEIARLICPGDCLLIKGSHSAHMERIVVNLCAIAAKHSGAPVLPENAE